MYFIILVETWPFMVHRETACLVAYCKGLRFESYSCRWFFDL